LRLVRPALPHPPWRLAATVLLHRASRRLHSAARRWAEHAVTAGMLTVGDLN
jgi:hypothetical protein